MSLSRSIPGVIRGPKLPSSSKEEVLEEEDPPSEGSPRGRPKFLATAEQHAGSAWLFRSRVVLVPLIGSFHQCEGGSFKVEDGVTIVSVCPFDGGFLVKVGCVLITFLFLVVSIETAVNGEPCHDGCLFPWDELINPDVR